MNSNKEEMFKNQLVGNLLENQEQMLSDNLKEFQELWNVANKEY